MGDFKNINDAIYDRLISRLKEEGYENINYNANNKIVDLIDAKYEDSKLFEELVIESIEIIKKHQ